MYLVGKEPGISVDVRFFLIKEILEEGDIFLTKIGTAYNQADNQCGFWSQVPRLTET